MAFYGFSPWHTQTCISVKGPNLRTILEGDNHSYVAIFGGDQTQKPHLEKRANLSKLPGFLNLTPKIFTKKHKLVVSHFIMARMYRLVDALN